MSDEQTPKDEFTLERRKFLALLSAAGVYVPPAAAALLASGNAWAQSLSSSSSSSAPGTSSSGPGSSLSGPAPISGPTLSGPSPISGPVLSGPTQISGPGTSGYSSSGSGEMSGPSSRTLYASADTFVRRDSTNTNEGGNPRLRVGVGPVTRGLVQFDPVQLATVYAGASTVQLVLRIASNHNNWGQQDNRTVDVIPLLTTFTEGNGKQSGLPGSEAVRGTGAGATWNTPNDPNISDDSPRGAHEHWRGGDNVAPQTAAGAVHLNQQVNVDIAWDVTKDVANGYSAWLIKVTDEGEEGEDPRWHHSGHHDDDERHRGRLPLGDDRGQGGTVEYYSREGAGDLGQPGLAPRLVISY